jgi:hypothetical protein
MEGGRHDQNPWTSFQLAWDEIERLLRQDKSLFGLVMDKIRYVVSGWEEALLFV